MTAKVPAEISDKERGGLTDAEWAGMTEKARADKWKDIGNLRFKDDNLDGAIVAYTEATKLNPREPAYYSNRAFAHYMEGDYQSAVEDAKRAIKENDSFAKAWVRLGIAQFSMQ